MVNNNKSLGVYVHIPFCLKKCNYCDFLSFSASDKEKSDYIDALCNEIYDFCQQKSFNPDTVYIGGGTPSVLKPELIEKLMCVINECFIRDIKSDGRNWMSEITIEVNPGTMDREKVRIYKECGINRISMGVQSLNDKLLERLGRIHRCKEFFETYSLLREEGFDNINTDLMFALPGQSFDTWKETLNDIIKLKPEHISFYSLIIEEGTRLYEDWKSGRLVETDDETDRKMYHYALKRFAEEGYNHYEISNAALPERESKHNLKYWSMEDYIGFGLGAHSFIDGVRFCNTDDFTKYINLRLHENQNSGKTEISRYSNSGYEIININSQQDNMEEFIFTGLRKIKGISKTQFKSYTGVNIYDIYSDQIKKMVNEGMLEDENGRLYLTKKGLDFASYVMREFIG